MKYHLIILFTLLSVGLAACGFSLAEDITPPPNYVPPTTAPTLGPSYPSTPPNPARGLPIYTAKCAGCHGEKGLGNGPQAIDLPVPVAAIGLADISRQSSPAAWSTIIAQGRIDRYMPGFTSLSEQQRWDVLAYVYSLSATPEALQRGASLFAEKCATCHGADGKAKPEADFTDQQFMSQMTGINLYRAVSEGVGTTMPAFSGQLAESDIWALAAYLRSLTFEMTVPTATPAPSATPTVMPATPTATTASAETTPATTPQAGATAEVSSTPVAAELTPGAATIEVSTTPSVAVGTVNGKVVRAAGGDLPSGLTILLRGFDHGQDASGNLAEVFNLSAPLGTDGAYSFANVEMPANRLFLTEVKYQGVSFQSDFTAVTEGTTSLELPTLTLYEMTKDVTVLMLDQVHIVSDFSTANTASFYEIYVLTNPSQEAVVVPTDGNSVSFISLPKDAQDIGYELASGSAPLMAADDGFAILPGADQYGIVAYFTLPYEKKLAVAQPFILAPSAVTLLVPEGVTLAGDQLTDAGIQTMQSSNYQTYTASGVAAGSSLTFTINGAPKSATTSPTTTTTSGVDTKTSLVIGLGGLGVVLILVGIYFFFRERASRADLDEEEIDEGEEEEEDGLGENADSLTDAIIALDDQFKSGAIAQEAYEKRRAELKARLKELM
jgi:mono/diheme cytochrome c family protein